MRCADCRDVIAAYADGELTLPEQHDVRDHLATCADCAREYETLVATTRTVKEGLVRHRAPDVLKARIRNSLAAADSPRPLANDTRNLNRRLVVAALAIALLSSSITLAVTRTPSHSANVERELLASHVRSLQPGHLTDVASTNQHNVKPWFNGRVDMSPAVPDLDSIGFPIVGGRIDYANGRTVPVVVYARRQHVINVYSWPDVDRGGPRQHSVSENGYHFVEWRSGGLELWAVSDLNTAELQQFVDAFRAATTSR